MVYKSSRTFPVVSSINGETGNITLTSNGNTVQITTPTSNTINLEVNTSATGILSINDDVTSTQFLVVGTAGTDFAINDNGTGIHTFNLPIASISNTGKLSNADWNTFNNKVSDSRNINTNAPLTGGGNLGSDLTLGITQSSTSTDGYLSSSDWNTFNAKQPAGSYVTSLSVVTANGFAGSFSAGTTPALTLNTTITGFLYGNGTAISAASISTGLTANTNTLTANLSTGIAGGQSVIGGTAAGESLTLVSTTNATKGNIIFGASGISAYDGATGSLNIGTTSTVTNVLFQTVSTTRASVPSPKMTTTQMNAITSPSSGMTVYDTTVNNLKFYNGAAWSTYGFNTIGTIDSVAASANGASASDNSLIMQSASATVPGLVNNTTQTFSGAKTFTGNMSITPATYTTDLNPLNISWTYNQAATVFQGVVWTLTDTASQSNALVFKIQKGATSLMSVTKNGQVTGLTVRGGNIVLGSNNASQMQGGTGGGGILDMQNSTTTQMGFTTVTNSNPAFSTIAYWNITPAVAFTGNIFEFQKGGTAVLSLDINGKAGFGITPTAIITVKAGTATANTAPIKLTSGTNLTTAETGAIEYNGTNLFFTRTGTTRETVWCGNDAAAAPATSNIGVILDYYGTSATRVLTTPNSWASVNIGGTVYKIPLYS